MTLLFRHQLRRQLGGIVVVALVVGLLVGGALAAAAGARRSSTAIQRFIDYSRLEDGFVVAEDHWPEGGLGETVLSAFADADDAPKLVHLAVREMPTSGKPAELLAAAGIDAEHIVAAARRLVGAAVRA